MKVPQVAFTDGWIDERLKDKSRKRQYTDLKTQGLMIWFHKNGRTVSFAVRVGTGKDRKYLNIGKRSTALTLKVARLEADKKRMAFDLNGGKPVIEVPTLKASIAMYELARKNGDPQTSKRLKPLPLSWENDIARFKDMFKTLLDEPINHLNRDLLLECRQKYAEARAKADGGKVDLRKVRKIFTTTAPMLRWYAKRKWIDLVEVEDLTPKPYKKCERYLQPGEWQASIPAINALENEAGLFIRFVLATGARTGSVEAMKWDEVNWGNWQKFRDADGVEHNALIWIPSRQKNLTDENAGDEQRRILICGESLAILTRLREIYDRERAEQVVQPLRPYTGVFPERVVQLWAGQRSRLQREIEAASGTARWNRYSLRHTHATYLELLGCPRALISKSLTHKGLEEGEAPVTAVYADADPARRFMANDPLAALAPWHLRLHKLFRDIEHGVQSDVLTAVQDSQRNGAKANAMRVRYGVDPKFINITGRKLSAVA